MNEGNIFGVRINDDLTGLVSHTFQIQGFIDERIGL